MPAEDRFMAVGCSGPTGAPTEPSMPPTRSERFSAVTASSPSRGSCARTRSTGTGHLRAVPLPARSRWAGGGRSLGAGGEPARPGVENVTQIMWPSDSLPELPDEPCIGGALAWPRTAGAGRGLRLRHAHRQGAGRRRYAYALAPGLPPTRSSLPDQRAAAFWVALDEATGDNGCMWFVPGSHREPMRPTVRPARRRNLRVRRAPRRRRVASRARPRLVHHSSRGHDVHYTRGNSTPIAGAPSSSTSARRP